MLPRVMIDALSRSPCHQIIETFAHALKGLGAEAPPLDVERWGFTVHRALSSRTREFHRHEHVLELLEGADPLATLAALYHDLVYVNVDHAVPGRPGELVAPFLAHEPSGWRLLPAAEQDEVVRDVLAVFGRRPGDVLDTVDGLNELLSAVVAVKELERVLTREHRLGLAAAIEATIPFREDVGSALEERLARLGLTEEQVADFVRRAVRLANEDVGNFADGDPARFLDNTWKLLPETNPALQTASSYGVRDYRVALMKMEAFLSRLSAGRIFHGWKGEPAQEELDRRMDAARKNLELGVRYLKCKLYSIAVVEALCVETGGDVPLDYFMGGLADPSGPPMKRIERFLPTLPSADPPLERVMKRLLEGGRANTSSFDTRPSPLAAFLTNAIGEPGVVAGVEDARLFWAGKASPWDFLVKQPSEPVQGIAEAAAHIADTRRGALVDIAARLRIARQA